MKIITQFCFEPRGCVHAYYLVLNFFLNWIIEVSIHVINPAWWRHVEKKTPGMLPVNYSPFTFFFLMVTKSPWAHKPLQKCMLLWNNSPFNLHFLSSRLYCLLILSTIFPYVFLFPLYDILYGICLVFVFKIMFFR